ncbi:MAG: prepilin peptidase [Deltaproteobacteria bacterium]|nr:prepilin peptidase [Deltaproteobacteria bacterium]
MAELSQHHHLVFMLASFVLGSLIGSFLNVVIARLPEGESIVHPRSRCPKCHDQIPAWLNIPILSWLILRGHCRACQTPISPRYPLVEILTGALYAGAFAQFGFSLAMLAVVLMGSALIAITFIDLDCWEIPDEISLPFIVVGAILRPFALHVPWYDGLVGALLGAAFLWLVRWLFWVLRRVEGMGLGDVKLIAMIGAFVGPSGTLQTILVASVTGTILGVVFIAGRRWGLWSTEEDAPANGDVTTGEESLADQASSAENTSLDEDEDWTPHPRAIPFGPFLALGALSHVFVGRLINHALSTVTVAIDRWLSSLL